MQQQGRVLALDWGKVRIGVALSDPLRMMATPLATLPARPQQALLEQLAALVQEHEVTQILVGLPLNMDGSEGASAHAARRFAEDVEEFGVDVTFVDERLSSYEAEMKLREIGRKPSRDKGSVDRAAAALLLQEFLDSHARG